MNADDWSQLAERCRALVHHASLLMGSLTHPATGGVDAARQTHAATAVLAAAQLVVALAGVPELAGHLRTAQRFAAALAAWQRSVDEGDPLERRYQTALLQQAAQVLISCLHIEALAIGECARVEAAPFDAKSRAGHAAP